MNVRAMEAVDGCSALLAVVLALLCCSAEIPPILGELRAVQGALRPWGHSTAGDRIVKSVVQLCVSSSMAVVCVQVIWQCCALF